MKVVYTDDYFADIGSHVFPLEKYHLIKEQLLSEKIITDADILKPAMPDIDDLKIVHAPEYVEDLRHARPTRRLLLSEMPVSRELIDAQILSAAGTYLAALTALREKVCYNDGGGFHHAFPDHAEGFCYVNDISFAAKRLLSDKAALKIAVIDCDLHQGNGTAYIFKDDPRVFTFSIHQEKLYPAKRQSDLDIGLENETGDCAYLECLTGGLEQVFTGFGPDFVFYLAGADPYQNDQLGDLNLTIEGLEERDEMVLGACRVNKTPVAIALGGGYAREIKDTVTIHVNTAKIARRLLGTDAGGVAGR